MLADKSLIAPLLDSWECNNAIILNLLDILSEESLEAKATQDGPTVAQLFTHIHYPTW